MTSTNDGKDVKSNQTSGQKGKTFYVELYKSLDGRLSGECELSERTRFLCEAWRRVHCLCQHSAPTTHPHLVSWLQRHTARTILQTEWQSPKSKDEHKHLEEAIDRFISECTDATEARNGVSPPWESQLRLRGEWFKKILANPWGHPVLRILLDPRGQQPTDDEILEWLKEERGVMFVTRLRQLAASKCDDLAMSLVTAVLDRVRATTTLLPDAEQGDARDNPATVEGAFALVLRTEAGFTMEVWELVTDIEFVLLHKADRMSKCIELAKQTPLRDGYQLVERLQSRLENSPKEKKLWKNAKEVATLIAQVIVARCMVVPVCAGVARTALYCCARSLARLVARARLPAAAATLAAPAATARHLHTLAAAFDAQCLSDMKPFVCELYVRAITAGMNELERLKLKTEKESEARLAEQTLCTWFTQLGSLLSASDRIKCECTLTAFSVHPSPTMYDRIKNAPILPPVTVDDQDIKQETTSEFGSWATDSRTQTNLVKTSETLNIKQTQHQANVLSTAILTEGEGLGLSPELCMDLAVLLSGPRLKTLSWDMDRELLLDNCRTYLERTHGGTRALTTELKYLNLDPSNYQHLPEEDDDDENNAFYGIEKGYEHLVELQEQDQLSPNAMFDFERTESAYSDFEIEPIPVRRKKKTKKLVIYSEEETDPLSLVAETKKEKKKERPLSKERSKETLRKERSKDRSASKEKKERKKKPKSTGDSAENKERSRERRKEASDKKETKEKKPRKKKPKEELPVEGKPGSLSSLIGMKVAKITVPDGDHKKNPDTKGTASVTDSDYDSQGKSSLASLNSEGNGPDVLFDGLFTDEYRSPEKADPLSERRSSFPNSEVSFAHGHVAINYQKLNKLNTNKSLLNMSLHKKKPEQTATVTSNPSSPKFSTVTDEVKKKITGLLEFRRQKNFLDQAQRLSPFHTPPPPTPTPPPPAHQSPSTPIKSPNAIIQPVYPEQQIISPKAVEVPEIPKVYINKRQMDQIKVIRDEVDVYLKSKFSSKPVIQYATKPTCDSPQSTIQNECLNLSTNKHDSRVPETSQQQMSCEQTVEPKQSSKQTSSSFHECYERSLKDFLRELHETTNAGTGKCAKKTATNINRNVKTKKETKKVMKPSSKVTPITPNVTSEIESSSSHCAKLNNQGKKVETQLNTFARLSYMHKNKQLVEPVVNDQVEINMINRFIEDQRKAKLKCLQNSDVVISRTSKSTQKTKTDTCNSTQTKTDNNVVIRKVEKTSVTDEHPLLTNLLGNSTTSSESIIKNISLQPVKRKPTPAPMHSKESSLSEKDQNDLLNLLRQQSMLNYHPAPYVNTDFSKVNKIVNNPQCSKIPTPTSSTFVNPNVTVIKNHPIETCDIYKINRNYDDFKTKNASEPTQNMIYANVIDCKTVKTNKPITSQKVDSLENCSLNPYHTGIETKQKEDQIRAYSATTDANGKDWQEVMNALLSHKTPSRGPNALDMALKKDSHSDKNLRNHRIVRPNVINETRTEHKVSSETYKKQVTAGSHVLNARSHQQTVKPPIPSTVPSQSTNMNIARLQQPSKRIETLPKKQAENLESEVDKLIKRCIQTDATKKLTKEICPRNLSPALPSCKQKSKGQRKKAFTQDIAQPCTQELIKRKGILIHQDIVKKVPNMEKPKRIANSKKPGTSDLVQEKDPFISGISNSDYDLLEELMDDELRKEIGELSSDEDTYRVQTSSVKSTKTSSSNSCVNVNKNATTQEVKRHLPYTTNVQQSCRDSIIKASQIQAPTNVQQSCRDSIIKASQIQAPCQNKPKVISDVKLNSVALNQLIGSNIKQYSKDCKTNSGIVASNSTACPTIIHKSLNTNVINNRNNEQPPHLVSSNHINVVDPRNVIITTMPQRQVQNVVLIGSELVYDPYAAIQTNIHTGISSVNQAPFVTFESAPNLTVFQTTQFAAPLVNPIIIGNAMTVQASPASLQETPLNSMIQPNAVSNSRKSHGQPESHEKLAKEVSRVSDGLPESHKRLPKEVSNLRVSHGLPESYKELPKTTQNNHNIPNKAEIHTYNVSPGTKAEDQVHHAKPKKMSSDVAEKDNKNSKDIMPHDKNTEALIKPTKIIKSDSMTSSIKNCERKVLKEVQEKQKLKDNLHESKQKQIIVNNDKKTDKELEKVVNESITLKETKLCAENVKVIESTKEIDRLKNKRLAILSREINNRINNPPIPLSYTPLVHKSSLSVQKVNPKETLKEIKRLDEIKNKNSDSSDCHMKLTEKHSDNSKENDSKVSPRRILLRSSNVIQPDSESTKINKITKAESKVELRMSGKDSLLSDQVVGKRKPRDKNQIKISKSPKKVEKLILKLPKKSDLNTEDSPKKVEKLILKIPNKPKRQKTKIKPIVSTKKGIKKKFPKRLENKTNSKSNRPPKAQNIDTNLNFIDVEEALIGAKIEKNAILLQDVKEFEKEAISKHQDQIHSHIDVKSVGALDRTLENCAENKSKNEETLDKSKGKTPELKAKTNCGNISEPLLSKLNTTTDKNIKAQQLKLNTTTDGAHVKNIEPLQSKLKTTTDGTHVKNIIPRKSKHNTKDGAHVKNIEPLQSKLKTRTDGTYVKNIEPLQSKLKTTTDGTLVKNIKPRQSKLNTATDGAHVKNIEPLQSKLKTTTDGTHVKNIKPRQSKLNTTTDGAHVKNIELLQSKLNTTTDGTHVKNIKPPKSKLNTITDDIHVKNIEPLQSKLSTTADGTHVKNMKIPNSISLPETRINERDSNLKSAVSVSAASFELTDKYYNVVQKPGLTNETVSIEKPCRIIPQQEKQNERFVATSVIKKGITEMDLNKNNGTENNKNSLPAVNNKTTISSKMKLPITSNNDLLSGKNVIEASRANLCQEKNSMNKLDKDHSLNYLKDKVTIEELPIEGQTQNSDKKCVRIKLPNGKSFKATVYGKMHVSFESLFSDPSLKDALLSNLNTSRRYTLNIKQVSTQRVDDPSKIFGARIEEIKLQSKGNVIETVNLLSDDEEEESGTTNTTEFDGFKISSPSKELFDQHRTRLTQKCFVKVVRTETKCKEVEKHSDKAPFQLCSSLLNEEKIVDIDSIMANEVKRMKVNKVVENDAFQKCFINSIRTETKSDEVVKSTEITLVKTPMMEICSTPLNEETIVDIDSVLVNEVKRIEVNKVVENYAFQNCFINSIRTETKSDEVVKSSEITLVKPPMIEMCSTPLNEETIVDIDFVLANEVKRIEVNKVVENDAFQNCFINSIQTETIKVEVKSTEITRDIDSIVENSPVNGEALVDVDSGLANKVIMEGHEVVKIDDISNNAQGRLENLVNTETKNENAGIAQTVELITPAKNTEEDNSIEIEKSSITPTKNSEEENIIEIKDASVTLAKNTEEDNIIETEDSTITPAKNSEEENIIEIKDSSITLAKNRKEDNIEDSSITPAKNTEEDNIIEIKDSSSTPKNTEEDHIMEIGDSSIIPSKNTEKDNIIEIEDSSNDSFNLLEDFPTILPSQLIQKHGGHDAKPEEKINELKNLLLKDLGVEESENEDHSITSNSKHSISNDSKSFECVPTIKACTISLSRCDELVKKYEQAKIINNRCIVNLVRCDDMIKTRNEDCHDQNLLASDEFIDVGFEYDNQSEACVLSRSGSFSILNDFMFYTQDDTANDESPNDSFGYDRSSPVMDVYETIAALKRNSTVDKAGHGCFLKTDFNPLCSSEWYKTKREINFERKSVEIILVKSDKVCSDYSNTLNPHETETMGEIPTLKTLTANCFMDGSILNNYIIDNPAKTTYIIMKKEPVESLTYKLKRKLEGVASKRSNCKILRTEDNTRLLGVHTKSTENENSINECNNLDNHNKNENGVVHLPTLEFENDVSGCTLTDDTIQNADIFKNNEETDKILSSELILDLCCDQAKGSESSMILEDTVATRTATHEPILNEDIFMDNEERDRRLSSELIEGVCCDEAKDSARSILLEDIVAMGTATHAPIVTADKLMDNEETDRRFISKLKKGVCCGQAKDSESSRIMEDIVAMGTATHKPIRNADIFKDNEERDNVISSQPMQEVCCDQAKDSKRSIISDDVTATEEPIQNANANILMDNEETNKILSSNIIEGGVCSYQAKDNESSTIIEDIVAMKTATQEPMQNADVFKDNGERGYVLSSLSMEGVCCDQAKDGENTVILDHIAVMGSAPQEPIQNVDIFKDNRERDDVLSSQSMEGVCCDQAKDSERSMILEDSVAMETAPHELKLAFTSKLSANYTLLNKKETSDKVLLVDKAEAELNEYVSSKLPSKKQQNEDLEQSEELIEEVDYTQNISVTEVIEEQQPISNQQQIKCITTEEIINDSETIERQNNGEDAKMHNDLAYPIIIVSNTSKEESQCTEDTADVSSDSNHPVLSKATDVEIVNESENNTKLTGIGTMSNFINLDESSTMNVNINELSLQHLPDVVPESENNTIQSTQSDVISEDRDEKDKYISAADELNILTINKKDNKDIINDEHSSKKELDLEMDNSNEIVKIQNGFDLEEQKPIVENKCTDSTCHSENERNYVVFSSENVNPIIERNDNNFDAALESENIKSNTVIEIKPGNDIDCQPLIEIQESCVEISFEKTSEECTHVSLGSKDEDDNGLEKNDIDYVQMQGSKLSKELSENNSTKTSLDSTINISVDYPKLRQDSIEKNSTDCDEDAIEVGINSIENSELVDQIVPYLIGQQLVVTDDKCTTFDINEEDDYIFLSQDILSQNNNLNSDENVDHNKINKVNTQLDSKEQRLLVDDSDDEKEKQCDGLVYVNNFMQCRPADELLDHGYASPSKRLKKNQSYSEEQLQSNLMVDEISEELIDYETSIEDTYLETLDEKFGNPARKEVTLVCKDRDDLVLTGIEYEDPVVGTCYVFPIVEDSDDAEEPIDVVQEVDDNELTSAEELGLYENDDLEVKIPKVTYTRLKTRCSAFKKMKLNILKRKLDMNDVIYAGKRYRKEKQIYIPRVAPANLVFVKEYKRVIEYGNSLKFSFSHPFHKDVIDVEAMLKNWPIKGACRDSDSFSDNDESVKLFRDDDNPQSNPTSVSFVDEISENYNDLEPHTDTIDESNFNMGFGEGSDRVIQNLEEEGDDSKFSAATLSDVKQPQPFLLSEEYDCKKDLDGQDTHIDDQLKKLKHYISYIQLRDKVRSFFKKTSVELSMGLETQEKDIAFNTESSIKHKTICPFDLCLPDFIEPSPIEAVVQVVQVGQLPVSAAAQNPVTCDPRVTQVSDASPSQCSVENSPQDDAQVTIKTEYTELTTADLTLPLVQEYEQHNQNFPMESENASNMLMSNENIPIETEIKSVVKIELEELPDVKEENRENFDSNEFQSEENKNDHNVDFSFDSNNTGNSSNLETDSDFQNIFNVSEKQNENEMYTQKQQNGTSEKTDQIAHAMNAAGITTSAETMTSATRAHALVNILSQKLRQGAISTTQSATNTYPKTTAINAMALQQALAQILPPPLNQTNVNDNNQQSSNTQVAPQVLHIVQGKNATGSQITLVDNSQQSVINNPNATPVLHIVQNKSGTTSATANGTATPQANSFSGLSLVDAGLQQGGNQLLHIVNTGSQKNSNATGQLLKRVNLLTNLANVQGSNEQKMVQFVCKSADGKSIQLNAPHQRSMVLRLQPIETPNVTVQATPPKSSESQDGGTNSCTNSLAGKDSNSQQEIKSRSVYEENYAKFIQNSSNKSTVSEKSTSLPKFNQAFGKPVFQDGNQKTEINSNSPHLSSVNNNNDTNECQSNDNAMNLDHISQISSPPLLLRKSPQTSQSQASLVQQLKQTIAPMNIQTMHGGVIYTRQIPVNIGGGQTINLITVPSTELIDESGQKQQSGSQNEMEQSIIKIVPQTQNNSNNDLPADENNVPISGSNENTQNAQPQQVLTQMRIKLPMLSKAPQMVSGARVVRPSFFQIQRNVIGGANQPVYQQLVLTAAPPLGQQTIRLPQAQTSRPIKVPSESQSSAESQMSSSTLEQLREFDMVLEQVKERSTVQPGSSVSTTFSKLQTASTDTTDSTSASSTSTESTQQVLYSIGNNQPLNVAYVNRKATVTTPTTSAFVRSPDSSGTLDSPTSSTHVQIPHTVTSDTTQNEPPTQQKPAKVSSKSKSRPKASSNPPNNLKLNTVPPKTSAQKPLEDEQTTQRILYILAEYKEQVENSPDKDKPAPRRRSNPPSNPGSSKRKKSSSGSRRHGVRDLSPVHGEDTCRTMGSEDSSCGTSQGDCNESCLESHSPQDSPRKVVRKLTFEHETTPTPQPRPQPQRNVIVADGQTITVARGTAGKPATAVLMPANYILPVSMVKGGQQIAIVTNRGPKLLTVGGGEGGATNALLLQRLIGPAGLKPVLARPGVRHVRLPTAALHNLQAFNLATTTTIQPPDSTASPAPAPTPPELVDTRATSSPWTDRDMQDVKPERASSPEGSEPWNLPSSGDPHDYSYEETVRADNLDRTVLDPIQDRYSPDMEAQRIFDKMFDVESKKSYMGDSHDDSPRCGYDIDASDCDDKAYHQVVQKKDGSSHRQHRLTHVSAAALRHKYAILEHELRLQKSLSEECEDLGVDSPSASELFPEAELLFAASPAHDHNTQDQGHHSHTPQPTLLNQSGIPQPDMDDQIATDQLLSRNDINDDQQDLNLGLEDVGIVTVSEDGMQATIALDQEEFARSHPNTTFHSEPTDDGEVQPFTIAGIKGRHITSTIFHSNRAPATVLMTTPQTTVISQATTDNSVKYDIDNMIHSLPSANNTNINLPSVLVKDDGLTRFDNILSDSRELHLSNTASAIVHSAGNAAQVIRRVCYDEDKRDNRFLMDEPDALIAGDDAKMIAEDSSRDATLESIAGDVDDDRSSPERHAELFWESNSASASESRRPLDFSSDSEKCCKSPSYDETNSTDSSGVGTHMRLDSVIKEARGIERSGSADGSSADDTHPPLRTYPPKRMYHPLDGDVERSLSGKTRAGERSPDSLEVRRRASGRGVVKRGCHCCNGSPAPPRPKKSRQRKPTMDFNTN